MSRALDLVHRVYEAVLDPAGPRAFTDLLMAELDGSSATMELKIGDQVDEVITSNIAPKVLDSYARHYFQANVLLQVAMKDMPHGRTTRNTDLVPMRDYARTEFYCDFAKPAEAVKVLGAVVDFGPSRHAAISVHRGHAEPEFSDAELLAHQRFMGPAAAALRVRRRLGDGALSGLAALEALNFGAVICDGERRLVFANGAAEASGLAGSGLVLAARLGGLTASLPDEANRLAHLVTQAAANGCAGAMSLTGAGGERTSLLVTPLPRRFGPCTPLVLVTLGAADGVALTEPALLEALFGFTPAEAYDFGLEPGVRDSSPAAIHKGSRICEPGPLAHGLQLGHRQHIVPAQIDRPQQGDEARHSARRGLLASPLSRAGLSVCPGAA